MPPTISETILHRWHRLLHLPRQSPPSWYRDRIREELRERRAATTSVEKLSETADVLFAISRARYDGFAIRTLPRFTPHHLTTYAYMLAKYTSRWAFYRALASRCGVSHHRTVREVVNPSKDNKLEEVALRHRIDPEKFKRIGCRLRRIWPLLP